MKIKSGGVHLPDSTPLKASEAPKPGTAQIKDPGQLEEARAFLGGKAGEVGAGTHQGAAKFDLKGAGKKSLFALRLQADVSPAEKLLGKVPHVGAKTVSELLAKLPLQTEIKQIVATEAAGGAKIPFKPYDDMKADLPKVYAQALERLPQLTSRFNPVELYTADDVSGPKEDFIERYKEGERFNPTLTYKNGAKSLRNSLAKDKTTPEKVKAELQTMRAEVAGQKIDAGDKLAGIMRKGILHKIDDDLSTLTLLEGLEKGNDRLVKDAFAVKYGSGVDDALFDASKVVFGFLVENQIHDSKKKKAAGPAPKMELPQDLAAHLSKKETMTAGEFKSGVDWMLGKYYAMYEAKSGKPFPPELKYKVEVNPKFAAIDVRDKSSDGPIIGIPDKARSPKEYLSLLRHEVDAHARQSLNGNFMFGFGGGALKVDEETWYEGLAKKTDTDLVAEMFGDNSSPTLPYYPFAIRMAEQGKSFVQVFEAMVDLRLEAGSSEKMALNNAWNTAYRVFRGHNDTGNKQAFAMPKDQAYLRGWMLHNQLADRGLSHLNEAAIGPLDGPHTLSQFDFGPGDLMFPDVDLTRAYFEEVMRPKAEAEMAQAKAEG